MNTQRIIGVLLVCSLTFSLTCEHDVKFQIIKSYPNSASQQAGLGKLVVTSEPRYKEATSYVDPDYPTLVNQADFGQSNTIVLTFRELNSESPRTFRTAVSAETFQKSSNQGQFVDKSTLQHKNNKQILNANIFVEKLLVYVDNNDLSIKTINYVQERATSKEMIASPSGATIQSQIVKMQKGREQIFKMVTLPPPSQQQAQQETFFSKYKWPIIIVGVIMYLSSSLDKGQGQAQGQGQPQGPARAG